jgi:hypothetical protein
MNLRPLAVATLVTAAVMALAPSASAEDHWQARPESNHHAAHASHVVGDSADWTWLGGTADLTPRWDPCATITWSYPAGASPMVQRVTDHSFMLLARFTGYSFQRVDQGGAITITIHRLAVRKPGRSSFATRCSVVNTGVPSVSSIEHESSS